MNMKKSKSLISKALIVILALGIPIAGSNVGRSTVVYAASSVSAKSDAVNYNPSVFNGEAQYLQYCLNRLGYTDYNGNTLVTDGYFGNITKSALDKFLKAQGYSYFSITAKNKLISLAENTANTPYDSGFTAGSNKLTPTAFVYSSISNINNSDNPFYSMSVLKELPFIITSNPTELSYKSMRVAEYIKSKTKLLGYVNLGPNNPTAPKSSWKMADLKQVKAQIDSMAKSGWYGVFVDQFGYDFNETRVRQNTIVDYAHSKGLKVMANCWFVEDALGSKVDKYANPKGLPSHLNSSDWYLVESFITDGTSYRGDSSYIEKYLKVKQYKDTMKINVAALSYKMDSTSWENSSEDIKMSYIMAQCLGFNGWWFGKTENSDNLLYGKDPKVDLGSNLIRPLKLESGNKYTAETDKYNIEYYAQSKPVLKLIPKN